MSLHSHFSCVFVVYLAVIIKTVLTFYGQSCPPPVLNASVAAKTCSDSSEYHCLYNGKSKLFESYCFTVEKFPAGGFVFYKGGLNSKDCPDDRYQPTVYFSNQYYSECMYSKTRCSEEGQVVYDNSFTEKDTTCRCDYTKGYDFVTKPKNRCFCIPAEEDCSCYKKQCPENTTLTPDYKCLKTVGLITCPVIKHKQDKPKDDERVNKKKDTSTAYNTIKLQSGLKRWHIVIAVAAMVMLLLIGCIVVIVSPDQTEESRTIDKDNDVEGELITSITRNGFLKSIEALEKYRLVVIKGRYGTGKSSMAKQISQRFPGYGHVLVQKEDAHRYINVKPDVQKQITIFDEVCGINEDEEGRSKIIRVMESFFDQRSNLLIITIGEFNHAFIESLRKMSIIRDDNLIDLDTEYALSKEEKLCMLHENLKQQGYGPSTLASLLPGDVKEEIVSIDIYHGFPLLCKKFCSEINNIKLGTKYFRQHPEELFNEIERIRVAASEDKTFMTQYSILVYILLSVDGCVNIHNGNPELIREISGYYFGLGFLHKECVHYLQMKDIPLQRFLLHMGDGKFTIHPTVYQAVLLSFAKFQFYKVVEKCKLEHILDLIRLPNYERLPNEIVLFCKTGEPEKFCKIVSKRMADFSLFDDTSAHMVCKYIVKTQYEYLSQQYFNFLELEIQNFITSRRVHSMLIIIKELVLEAKIRHEEIKPILTAWTFLVYNKYGKENLIADQMKTPVFSGMKTFLLAMLGTFVDEYDNNLLTYCTLWWETGSEHPLVKAVSNLLSKSQGNLSPQHLFKRTKYGLSPVDFAAHFGRHECLQIFLPLHERDAEGHLLSKAAFHKLRYEIEELIELARKGERKILLDKIKYNPEICPKVEIGTDIDFEKTHIVLEEFRDRLSVRTQESDS